MFGVAPSHGNARFILKPSATRAHRLAELIRPELPAWASSARDPATRRRSTRSSTIPTSRRSASAQTDIAQYVCWRARRRGGQAGAGDGRNEEPRRRHARRRLDEPSADLVAAFSSAGERCITLPVVVPAGANRADTLREALLPKS
jgi:malonate-semialdehyde dehydrogenase (acetylating)/methylmalonate-semialdehyde dehydrogenase